MAQISAVRPGEPLEPYDYSILLLGGSGNGKSTFVNIIVNVILGNSPGNFQAAVPSRAYPNIIPELDDGLRERNTDDGTTYVHFYKLKSSITDNKTILIIDTPGLVSLGGINKDDENVQTIINSARRVKTINAIIVVEKSSTNRLSPSILYNLYRISEIIPNDFESKVILALTFYLGTSLYDDNWLPFPINYKLKMNNGAFGYSSSDYQAKPANVKKVDWDKSVNKIKKLFTHLFTMQKIPTVQYTNLFDYHNAMMNKIADFKSCIDNIEKCKYFTRYSTFGEKLIINNWINTNYHKTACSEHRALCHKECYLSCEDSNKINVSNNCACMNAQKACKICEYTSEQHAHRHENPAIEMASIDQMLNSCSIVDRSFFKSILRVLKDNKKKLIIDLVEVGSNINSISSKYKISKYIQMIVELITLQSGSEKDPNKLKELLNAKALYRKLSKGMKGLNY